MVYIKAVAKSHSRISVLCANAFAKRKGKSAPKPAQTLHRNATGDALCRYSGLRFTEKLLLAPDAILPGFLQWINCGYGLGYALTAAGPRRLCTCFPLSCFIITVKQNIRHLLSF